MKIRPVYGRTKEPATIKPDQDVLILSGKYKGRKGYVMYETYAHPLNEDERMYCVRYQTGGIRGRITLKLQEKNLSAL